MIEKKIITDLLYHQLKNYWVEINYCNIDYCIDAALFELEVDFKALMSKRFCNEIDAFLNPMHSVSWSIFLYKLSRQLYVEKFQREADAVYYLNKVMHSVDWFYQVKLPTHFMAEHPLGSVLGKAQYGDFFFVYQGTTVGGNRKNGVLSYPKMGNNVLMYANSTILGETVIGNNVVISANSYIINENIPDNSIVFGNSPNIIIKTKTEEEILKLTEHIWKRL